MGAAQILSSWGKVRTRPLSQDDSLEKEMGRKPRECYGRVEEAKEANMALRMSIFTASQVTTNCTMILINRDIDKFDGKQ